ncbi:S-layer homology domain-containing protein [Paenibacillus ferrarius]|uniref:S-layer homology domain-containing protein n=1 Tax=Paenibacillus ferrarius TaxID=1469647 RepID=UPI003D27BAB4
MRQVWRNLLLDSVHLTNAEIYLRRKGMGIVGMKRVMARIACLFLVFSMMVPMLGTGPAASAAGGSVFEHFISRQGDKLMDGEQEFRFISTNMPDVLQIITDKRFESNSRLRLPNEYELRDAVETVKQMNGRVMRTFVVTVAKGDDPNYMVNASIGENDIAFNEGAMLVLDKLLQICNELGVRVYIPLVNYNDGIRGGAITYGEQFYTVGSPANIRFKKMVEGLLNRTNTFTGVQYKEDKAILGWESGNELVMDNLPERNAWLHDLAAYVKQLASNQLFIDGRNKPDDIYKFSGGTMIWNYTDFLNDDNIDILSYHTYVGTTGPVTDTAIPTGLRMTASGDIGATNTLKIFRELTKGKKSLVVGEIAMYMAPSTLITFLDELIADGTSGANWWATRFHNRDGGFYKHSDNGSQFEDLNWPGFPDTTAYLPEISSEIAIQKTLSEKAWKIMGEMGPPPALPQPAAPTLLPIADVGHISWQGSTGAQSYEVQRGNSAEGPWTVAGVVYDNLPTYSSLFHDAEVQAGHTYYYRILARNSSGVSLPSSVSPPVAVQRQWIVDELFDLTKIYNREPNAAIFKSYANTSNQEDLGVLKSVNGTSTSVQYAVGGKLTKANVYVYNAPGSVSLYGSLDGQQYYELNTAKETYEGASRTKYIYAGPSNYRFLKLEMDGAAAVSRVELEYEPDDVQAPESETIASYRNPNKVLEAELFNYNENNFSESDVVTNNRGVVKVNQTGGSNNAASNKRFSIVDFLQTGDYVVFYANLEAGTYDLQVDYDARAARGKFQMSILEPGAGAGDEGMKVGDVIDAYDPGSGVIKSANYGKVTLAQSGRYGFKFVSMGKNNASSNVKIGLDVIKLLSDNVPPTVTDATYAAFDDTPVHGSLTANDANGDMLTYMVIHQPSAGQLTVNADGTFLYMPARGQSGQFAFKWKVNDGWINSDTAQVTFNVTATGGGDSSPVGGGSGSNGIPNAKPAWEETLAVRDGRTVVSATVDPDAFGRAIDTAGLHGEIPLEIAGKGDLFEITMNGVLLAKLQEQENTLNIVTEAGSYRLPVQAVDWEATTEHLGGKLDLNRINVQFSISRSSEQAVRTAKQEAARLGVSLAASPVSFDVTLTAGDQAVPIHRFLAYVERTIPLLSGSAGNQVVSGIRIQPDGSFQHIPARLVEKNGQTSVVMSSMTNSAYGVVAGSLSFSDTERHWGRADINELGSRLIAQGTTDGLFEPDRQINRAEFTALLNRTLGLGAEDSKAKFLDVHPNEWFAGEVGTAQGFGLISGYDDGSFGPNRIITREEAMQALAKAARLLGISTSIADQEIASLLLPYEDRLQVGTWARSSAVLMVKLGIIQGRGERLDPKEPITRAEAAAMMLRLLRASSLI